MRSLLTAGLVLLVVPACPKGAPTTRPARSAATSSPVVGGPCTYKDTPGVAKIVSVGDQVRFDFEAEGKTGSKKGLRLKIWDGKNPPAECARAQGLRPGTRHPALRSDIVAGTCTPVVFRIKSFDQNKCKPGPR